MHLHQCTQHGQQTVGVGSHHAALANCDLVAIMETWWDFSYDWRAAVNSYKFFRRDSGVALHVREHFSVEFGADTLIVLSSYR